MIKPPIGPPIIAPMFKTEPNQLYSSSSKWTFVPIVEFPTRSLCAGEEYPKCIPYEYAPTVAENNRNNNILD